MSKVNGMEGQFQKADEIKQFLKNRRQILRNNLENLGFAKELKRLNKEFIYYSERIKEYKKIFSNSAKLEEKVLGLLAKMPAFKKFFDNNSHLAQLFRLPGSSASVTASASLAGLQTRASLMQDIQNRFGSAPSVQQMMQNNMQQAQDQLSNLKNKLQEVAHKMDGSDLEEIPDFNFNRQKVKNFWRRIEVSANFQNQRGNRILPETSDIGLSVGYKLNDKSIIGFGGSYKLGWKGNIRKIDFTNQGAGIRCFFIDWQLKGSFWLSGGYEMNYRPALLGITFPLAGGREIAADLWQKSCLAGISKTVSLRSKFFKKAKAQLLFDFLNSANIPKTQALIFRIGYSF